MPRLTPTELQAARVRSGRLGGRPRLPTPTEAREAALDRLVPGSLRALAAQLGTETEPNPQAWRAALKVLELRYGPPPPEPESVALPTDADDIAGLSWQQMRLLAASLVTVTANDADDAMPAATGTITTTP